MTNLEEPATPTAVCGAIGTPAGGLAADAKGKLARRLSAPPRMESSGDNLAGSSGGAARPENVNQQTTAANAGNEDKTHRYSHREPINGRRRQARAANGLGSAAGQHHKSASPLSSSSSASDSAFSQSRSTLGSECEQSSTSNCFTANSSLRASAFRNQFSTAKHQGPARHLDDTSNYRTLASDGRDSENSFPSLTQVNEGHHFKILWQNLSYKVPEKRFSKLAAKVGQFLERHLDSHKCNPSLEDGLPYSAATSARGGGGGGGGPTRQRPRIFSNLNGCVRSGQLTAILGPSGAGKTTFLKCLTNSIVEGVSGSIDIVGGPKVSSQKHLKLCIIPQKDYLFDNLTVMENLLFASRIKNTDANMNHRENVHRVASLLGLQACLELKTSRLSGGQYKRVSIAQELLSQPDILILDEPTSGLDSLTCFKTVSVLRDLVNMSQAGLLPPLSIVMTIHQPQIKIFNLFHHVYILSSMGQCVYEGRPEYLVDTVANCCNLLPPPDDQNPASFIIDLGSEVYGGEPIERLVKLQLDNFLIKHTELAKLAATDAIVDEECVDCLQFNMIASKTDGEKQFACCANLNLKFEAPLEAPNKQQEAALTKNSATKATPPNKRSDEFRISEQLRKRHNRDHNFWLHTGLLVRRLWMSMWRDSLLAKTRFSFHLIIPFVFYFVYSQKSGSANACPHVERELDIRDMISDTNIQRLTTQHDELILTFENVSLFFLLLYSFSMCVLAVTALSFPLNMQILLKETSNGWYTMPRFVMAKTLADLPVELAMPMLSVSIAYAITGQPSSYFSWRMLTVTAVMTLCSLISQTQGLLFGAYFMNNVQAAVFISQASTLPWILLSGFTTRVSQLPKLLQWLSFGSIYRLGIESIVAVRYGFGMCPCEQELIDGTPTKMVGIPDQLKSVMSYYMDTYAASEAAATPPTTTISPIVANSNGTLITNAAATAAAAAIADQSSNSTKVDLFEKIAATMSRANTFGVDIVSCHDVRPFIMSAREVDESTLPTFMLILVSVLIGLKILLFYVVRIRAG